MTRASEPDRIETALTSGVAGLSGNISNTARRSAVPLPSAACSMVSS